MHKAKDVWEVTINDVTVTACYFESRYPNILYLETYYPKEGCSDTDTLIVDREKGFTVRYRLGR